MIKKFTLIELLVVVAIIGILVSILMPSLSKAREMGKRTVCLSNLKQFATASTIYGLENNGRLSPSRGKFAHLKSVFWLHGKTVNELDPYIGSWQISNCPNARLNSTKAEGTSPTSEGSSMIGYNYLPGIDVSSLVGSGESWESPYFLTDDNDLPLITDRLQGSGDFRSFVPHTARGWKSHTSWEVNPEAIGSQGANQVLLDCSAKWNSSSNLTGQKASQSHSYFMWWKLPD